MPEPSTQGDHSFIYSIIKQVQQGDTQAYSKIIRLYQKKMLTYCRYLLGNVEDAEDAVQEVFVKSYSHLERFEPTHSFSAWLYKIAYHHCMNIIKKRKTAFSFLKKYRAQQQTSYEQIDPYDIDAILELLHPQERHILILRAIEQYNFEEIGPILGISAATTRKKYERLRKKILQNYTKGGSLHAKSYRSF